MAAMVHARNCDRNGAAWLGYFCGALIELNYFVRGHHWHSFAWWISKQSGSWTTRAHEHDHLYYLFPHPAPGVVRRSRSSHVRSGQTQMDRLRIGDTLCGRVFGAAPLRHLAGVSPQGLEFVSKRFSLL